MTIRPFFLPALALALSGCLTGDTKCCDLVDSYPISKGLYVEKYRTFCAGVFGELIECYVTDSAAFRQKIGSYDEHESFRAKLNGDKIETYNIQSSSIPDTVERKTFYKYDLWKCHHSDTNCLAASPVFGTNTIQCDTNFYPAGSYKTDDGYFIAQVQYKCGNDYSNAVFYTDSLNFCIFVGVNNPGKWNNNYSVRQNNNGSFDFYNVTYRNKLDTVSAQTYPLSDLKKRGFAKVCK